MWEKVGKLAGKMALNVVLSVITIKISNKIIKEMDKLTAETERHKRKLERNQSQIVTEAEGTVK